MPWPDTGEVYPKERLLKISVFSFPGNLKLLGTPAVPSNNFSLALPKQGNLGLCFVCVSCIREYNTNYIPVNYIPVVPIGYRKKCFVSILFRNTKQSEGI